MRWLVPAVSAALGALIGCLVGVAWTSVQSAESPSAQGRSKRLAAKAEHMDVHAAQDEGELARLSARVRSLEQRVSLLTAALGETRRDAGAEGARGEGAGDGIDPSAADVADPVFEAAVRDILDRVEDDRRVERTTRAQQRAQHGARRAAERLTQELSLSDHQQQELFEVLRKHYETLAELRDTDSADQPATPGEWRERMAEIRRSTEEQLGNALSPKQLEKYQELDASEFFGGPRRRSRPRAQ